jgi:hypothetical protein
MQQQRTTVSLQRGAEQLTRDYTIVNAWLLLYIHTLPPPPHIAHRTAACRTSYQLHYR